MRGINEWPSLATDQTGLGILWVSKRNYTVLEEDLESPPSLDTTGSIRERVPRAHAPQHSSNRKYMRRADDRP